MEPDDLHGQLNGSSTHSLANNAGDGLEKDTQPEKESGDQECSLFRSESVS